MSTLPDFEGRFAVLGYGSLIWDLEILGPHVELPWFMGLGPALPMEFSRISPKRLLGLVVVLDPDHGSECPTHAIPSRKNNIHAVADDLCARERASDLKFIGAVCRRSGFSRSHSPRVAELVEAWCENVSGRPRAIVREAWLMSSTS